MKKNNSTWRDGMTGKRTEVLTSCPFKIPLFQNSIIPIFLFLFLAGTAQASDHLLYFEAQGVAGYSSDKHRAIYYSMNPDAEMQKPSLGFDYIQRFSGESGDIATFALQARLALAGARGGYK